MTKTPLVSGLDDFQLSLAGLTRLGKRPVRLSVQLVGQSVSALQHLEPPQRCEQLRETLVRQLDRLGRRFPEIEFVSRGRRKPSWTIDAVVPARQVGQLASAPEVHRVDIDTIEGCRKKPRRRELRWFCVWGIVAIQIEGRDKGLIDVEDRLVVVKAFDADDAQRRLEGEWSKYAQPYLNTDGCMVRWQLVDVRDTYEVYEDTFDPRGTEVFSRLRTVRLRPEHRWTPQAPAPRARPRNR